MSKYPWKITQRVQSYQSRWNQRTDEGTFRTLLARLGLFPVSIWTFWRNNEFKILSVISFIFLNTGKDKCRTSLLPEVSGWNNFHCHVFLFFVAFKFGLFLFWFNFNEGHDELQFFLSRVQNTAAVVGPAQAHLANEPLVCILFR